ncbi:MAG: hypothetical protein E2P02_05480, partial [Acidobacteria bacterium]
SVAMARKHSFEVYLPVGYDTSDTRYPVVYFHGGSNASRLGRLTNTLDALIGTRLQAMIVVLIDIRAGGVFRAREPYAELWANELVPFIDEHYRTIATREARAHAGAGHSAHDAAYCAFRYPALSAKRAVQSFMTTDFGWEKLEPLITTAEEHPLKLHIEWGRYDLRSPHEDLDTGEITRAFVAFLEGRGYEVEAFEVADGSGWPAWRNRNDVILASLFPLTGAK